MQELLELAERFQTAIVGVVGFAGVVWTLRTNANLARAQHQREIDTRRRALRRLLAAELRNYSRALRVNAEANVPNGETFSVGKVRKIYADDLARDLGLLELNEVDVVVSALITLDGLQHHLENMSSKEAGNRFLLPSQAFGEFREISSKAADSLDFAVEALEFSGEA